SFDDQLANRPALAVHQKIADMADDAIGGLKVVAFHGLGAPQMCIRTLGLRINPGSGLARRSFWRHRQNWKTTHAPNSATLPVIGPAIIPMILRFVLPRHRLVRRDRRNVLDLFA